MLNLLSGSSVALRPALATIFALFALQSVAQNDITADADAAFDRGGYFEAAKDYQASYAKLKGDWKKRAACVTASVSATDWAVHCLPRKSGTSAPSTSSGQTTIPNVFKHYGMVFMGQGEFDDAIEQFEKYKLQAETLHWPTP